MADDIEIKDYDIDPETGDYPDEFYEQEYRLGLEDAARDIPRLFQKAENLVDGIQEMYDYWDEEPEGNQFTEADEWINDTACLDFLEDFRKQGRLTKQQERKFVAIIELFKTHLPQVRYMDLYVPEFIAEK